MNRRLLLTATAFLGALGASRQAAAATLQAHRLALHVDQNDAAVMNMALGNAGNAAAFFTEHAEGLAIELVAYGPGLTMLRADTSPVKERLAELHEKLPHMVFSACRNTMEAMKRAEGKEIPLLAQVRIVPAGVVRLIELQEQGWSYIRV
jgi:intracellular sulfur oxidation DsrE/DsrF family protein